MIKEIDLKQFRLTNAEVAVLKSIQKKCYEQSKAMGWHNRKLTWWEPVVKLALIHSEVSEALEGLRKDKQDDHLPQYKAVEVELADAMIRIFDMAESCKMRLATALAEKHKYNSVRPDHKIKHRKAKGGKKF